MVAISGRRSNPTISSGTGMLPTDHLIAVCCHVCLPRVFPHSLIDPVVVSAYSMLQITCVGVSKGLCSALPCISEQNSPSPWVTATQLPATVLQPLNWTMPSNHTTMGSSFSRLRGRLREALRLSLSICQSVCATLSICQSVLCRLRNMCCFAAVRRMRLYSKRSIMATSMMV